MHDDLKDFTIVQISDLHICPLLGREFLQDVVDRVNQLKPSLVAITGDLMDGKLSQLRETVRIISQLQSVHGSYFVAGNHEYYSGHAEWMIFLKQLGIKVLENESDFLNVGNATVLVGGVPDYMTSPISADPHRSILHSRGKADLSILLAHQPRGCTKRPRQVLICSFPGILMQVSFILGLGWSSCFFPTSRDCIITRECGSTSIKAQDFGGLRYDLEHDQKLPISNLEMNNCLKIYQLKHNFALPVSGQILNFLLFLDPDLSAIFTRRR